MEDKTSVRTRMKLMRRNLSAAQVRDLSTAICGNLMHMEEIRQAETVLLYAAVRGEVQLDPLVRIWSASARTVPSLMPVFTGTMPVPETSATLASSVLTGTMSAPASSAVPDIISASGQMTVSGEESFRPSKTLAYPRVCGDEILFYEVRNETELVPGAFGIPEPSTNARRLSGVQHAVILVPGVAFMENGNRIGMGKGYYDRFLAHVPALLRIGIAYESQLEAAWEPEPGDLPMDFIVTEKRVIHCHKSTGTPDYSETARKRLPQARSKTEKKGNFI